LAATGLAREARIAAGPGVRAVAGGGNAPYLADRLDSAARGGASAIISFGIAGGLRSGLLTGSWLVGRAVVDPAASWPCDPTWTRSLAERLAGAIVADLAGSDTLVFEPDAKRALHAATHAASVDMESHIAARIAAAHGLPFAAFRVIADPVDRTLPAAASTALRPGGTIDGAAVARALMRRPEQIPLMVRSALDAHAALRALLRGRRMLGSELGYTDARKLFFNMA
jgi:adenosylhomocysteine nucleosidase